MAGFPKLLLPPILAALTIGAEQPAADPRSVALELLKKGRNADAVPLLEQATRAYPKDSLAWRALGVAWAGLGDYRAAEPAFAKACDLDPADPDACYFWARALYGLDRFQDSLRALDRLADKRPAGRVQQARAQALEALGKVEEAEKHYRSILASYRPRPDDDPRLHYGVFLIRQGRSAEAITVLRELLKDYPKTARAHRETGRALLSLGKPDEAASHLEQAIALEPGSAVAHLLLGRCYQRMGRPIDAERHLQLGAKSPE